jgi:hypothetical protein
MSCLVLRRMPHTQRTPLSVLAGLRSCRSSYVVSYAIVSDIPARSRMSCSVFTCFARSRRFRTSSQVSFQSFFAGVARSRCRTFSVSYVLVVFALRDSVSFPWLSRWFSVRSSFRNLLIISLSVRPAYNILYSVGHLLFVLLSCVHLFILFGPFGCVPPPYARLSALWRFPRRREILELAYKQVLLFIRVHVCHCLGRPRTFSHILFGLRRLRTFSQMSHGLAGLVHSRRFRTSE